MKIAVYAQEEFQSDFAAVLQAHEVEFADEGGDLLEALREFDSRCFDRFVIMDEAAGDGEVVGALREFVDGPRADRSNMLPVFVSNALREQPSSFYHALVMELGIEQVIACREGSDYDYFGDLVRTLRYPLRRSDVAHLCAKEEQREELAQAAAQFRVGDEPFDYRKTTRIAFAQPARRNGSTHTAYACAAFLSSLGMRVALVGSEAHMATIRRAYPRIPFDDDAGCLCFPGIDMYAGDGYSAVPDGYDYVLIDQGTALWLYEHKDASLIKRANAQLDVFKHVDHRVMCSFASPSGMWEFAREDIKAMGPRLMATTTFSVFGAGSPEIRAAFERRLAGLSERARFVSMPYLPAPLFIKQPQDAPEAVVEMLRKVVSPWALRRAEAAACPAADPQPEERAREGLFKRMFNR